MTDVRPYPEIEDENPSYQPQLTDSLLGTKDPEGTPETVNMLISDVLELTAEGALADLFAALRPFQARLTLATATPITTTDQTAKTTVYLTPFRGNQVALFDGVDSWQLHSLSEISVAVPSNTNTPFDLFVYDVAGTLTLEAVAWTNDTTRATNIVLQDGIYVKSGATERRYCGTGRTTGSSGQTEDSEARRLLWNYYNRVPRLLRKLVATDTWNYNSASWRQWNGDAANQVDMVIGVNEEPIEFYAHLAVIAGANGSAHTGIGLDRTNASDADLMGFISSNSTRYTSTAKFKRLLAAGYHYLALVERVLGANTSAQYGDNGEPTNIQSGGLGEVMG